MQTIPLGQTDLHVSTLCLGVMPWGARVHGEAAWALGDRFREAGGNFFDTAHCYSFWVPGAGAGSSERAFGHWVAARGIRDQVVIGTKGAHPAADGYRDDPVYMSQARIAADIDDSLERLGTDYIDLYWLHRDDPRIPVAEILGWLEAERSRGRIRAYGGSNWTSARLAAAAAQAQASGYAGFVGSQPRWNLLQYPEQPEAERLAPGALLHLNAPDRAWHTQSQLPVICYSAAANGFFAGGGPRTGAHETPVNQARRDRAQALATTLGCTPNQVCLAWLRAQPFPVVGILGTANSDHLADALGSVHVQLTAAQRDWLENGD